MPVVVSFPQRGSPPISQRQPTQSSRHHPLTELIKRILLPERGHCSVPHSAQPFDRTQEYWKTLVKHSRLPPGSTKTSGTPPPPPRRPPRAHEAAPPRPKPR